MHILIYFYQFSAGPRERSPPRKNLVVGELQLEVATQVNLSESAMDKPRHGGGPLVIGPTPDQVSL